LAVGNLLEDDDPPAGTFVGMRDRVVSASAYVTFVPAAVFLLIPNYRNNRFVRFHSLQSIFLSLAVILAAVAVRVIFLALSFVPSVAFLVGWLAAFVVALAFFFLWVVLVAKTLQGEMFELPLVGKIANKQSA